MPPVNVNRIASVESALCDRTRDTRAPKREFILRLTSGLSSPMIINLILPPAGGSFWLLERYHLDAQTKGSVIHQSWPVTPPQPDRRPASQHVPRVLKPARPPGSLMPPPRPEAQAAHADR